MRQPPSGNAEGLFDALNRAFVRKDIADSNWKNRLVGLSCDGTNVNMGLHGLRGYIEESIPWVVTIWCFAHRLGLTLKDALRGTYFDTVDDMLLHVYYLYEKSPTNVESLMKS